MPLERSQTHRIAIASNARSLQRCRLGFTLVEMLVTLSIIGLLVSLLLPAVQAVRETGRRIQCQNHLKQTALALQNYHDHLKTFPSGYLSLWDNAGNDTEPGVDGEGVFFRNSRVGIEEITDGTHATMMVGERSHRWGQATWVGAVVGAVTLPPPGSPAVPIPGNASSLVLGHTFEGPPNAPNIEGNNFSSLHTEGANFGFAHGHVQFISTTISLPVYRALSTRAGAETIEEF